MVSTYIFGQRCFILYRMRDDKAKIENFWEQVVPEYHDAQFRRTFRVPRSVFSYILDNIQEEISFDISPGRQSIPASKKLAIF